jgi:hypothetical protein
LEGAFLETIYKLKYVFYLIFRPFNGFWELKYEKKGNKRTALILFLLLVFVFLLRSQMTGFVIQDKDPSEVNIFFEIISIVLPFLLWCVANWGITTLLDGEGTMGDIFIATAYAMVPLILINVPLIIFSNFITLKEMGYFMFLDSLSVFWAGFLLFIGIMTIHQYTVLKTFLTMLLAIVGIVTMLVLGMMFFALIQQAINFFYMVYQELSFRL